MKKFDWRNPSQLVTAAAAVVGVLVSYGVLPSPWDVISTSIITALSAVYVAPSVLTRCPACGEVHRLAAPPTDTKVLPPSPPMPPGTPASPPDRPPGFPPPAA